MRLMTTAIAAMRRVVGTSETREPDSLALPHIPAGRRNLLFLSTDEPASGAANPLSITLSLNEHGDVDLTGPAEPSTIYASSPVTWPAPAEDQVTKLGYFPSYAGMTPDQRGVYLAWLQDVRRPIEPGYVFTYYYGLERHLIEGDFLAALGEILLLRQHHANKSFQVYSGSALLHACLMRGRADVLQSLYTDHGFDYFGNSSLLLLHRQKLPLLPDMLLMLAERLPGVNRRYLKSERELYRGQLMQLLTDELHQESYEFWNRYPLESVDAIPHAIFANVSFPPETRTPQLPNLMSHPPFQDEMLSLFGRVHERAKAAKRMRSTSSEK
ncbi:TerB N-terminal domain-containing protein [Achromobacter sp. 413638]|uniref:TerB N-terminal domain-containing protein n=1 Tax=Achromobacter sp. 413638 TaxID=3342385 RepID=UPI00370CB388